MFPLVHYFVNSQIYKNVSPLMALGGVFPDLAAGAGMDRDEAHTFGRAFHAWCQKNAPRSLDLALGIISHGTEPPCVDHYADEYWPGYRKGWCFMQGEKYMDEVARVTHLPENYVWWKSHNVVEISYELLTEEKHPQVRKDLLAAIKDETAIKEASSVISRYSGIPEERFLSVFHRITDFFALETLTPLELAKKQNLAFVNKFNIADADVEGMAKLFCRIRDDMREGYEELMDIIITNTARELAAL